MDKNLVNKLNRVLDLQKELDLRKALYAELDALIVELAQGGFKEATLNEFHLELVDNFSEKNTCFRPAGVKRFEIDIEPLAKFLKRKAKA